MAFDKTGKYPGVVYLVMNRINGKAYVGKCESGNIRRRWQRHTWIARTRPQIMRIASAISKYGQENFDIAILAGASSKSELLSLERSFIASIGTRHRAIGYNATDGGDGSPGYERSEEHRKSMAERLRARWANPEWAEETKRRMKGRKIVTPEQRARASILTRLSWKDPVYRLQHSVAYRRKNNANG